MPRLKEQDLINQREKQAYEFYISRGYSPAQSAGIVGNLIAESNLNPTVHGDSGKAFGIAQWHPDRQANFKKAYGKSIKEATFEEQLSFVDWELKNTEKAAGRMLLSATTPEQAGRIITDEYKRPAKKYHENPARPLAVGSVYKKYVDPNYTMKELSVKDYGDIVRNTMAEMSNETAEGYLSRMNYDKIPTQSPAIIPQEENNTDKEQQTETDDIHRRSLENKMQLYNLVTQQFQEQKQQINQLYDQQEQPTQQEQLIDPYEGMLSQPPQQFQKGGVIEDDMGQWKYPGQVTKINSGNITMQGVNYPILGVDNLGNIQIMQPNQNYQFPGTSVTEYPLI